MRFVMPAFRGHDPARKFHCDVLGCSASFVKRAHLRRHEMTHTQRRDFTCPGCNRAFSRNDSMARHLRRKHPELYRSTEATSAPEAGVDRLYAGVVPGVATSSTASANYIPASSYGMLSMRSPFESSFNSNNGSISQRRGDDHRLFPDQLSRPSSYTDVHRGDAVPYSPKGVSTAQWRDASSRMADVSFLTPAAPPYDGMRSYQSRPNHPIKEETAGQLPFGASSFCPTGPEPVGRNILTRRPANDQNLSMYRSDWTQGSSLDHECTQVPGPSHVPWEHQEGQMMYAHPSAQGSWPAAEANAGGVAIPSSEHSRGTEATRSAYANPGIASAAFPSGLASFGEQSLVPDSSMQTDVLQSEFFVGAMPSRNGDDCWASLDPSMLTAQSGERVRVESTHEHGQHYPDIALAPDGFGLRPSEHSTTGPETCFPVDFRNLSEHTDSVAPPNAEHVEQIMADLGIDLNSSQASAFDAPRGFSSQTSFNQPGISMTAAPLIPSQTAMPSSWPGERFAPPASSFHPHSLSQAQSSQSSAYLPSLTASQTEYLGPNANSHRRTLDRSWSSASMAFDTNSQPRAPQIAAYSFACEAEESVGRPAELLASKPESQKAEDPSSFSDPNFNKPHDSSPLQRAARFEEGGRKSARGSDNQHQTKLPPESSRPTASDSQDELMHPPRMADDKQDGPIAPANLASQKAMDSMGPPRRENVAFADPADKSRAEVDEPALPATGQQPDNSAPVSTSTVSSDQLQHIVSRFQAFAQLCQDHLRPSTAMLECLTPLIFKVIRADAPFYHPIMLGTQKAHSSEEAIALLSLASLQSSDPHVAEEGHRLICFLYGSVMLLSYGRMLHLGGKPQSFLNCFLLVGMYGLRQHTPDFWHKLKQNSESILLDVLKIETRPTALDVAMDRIETDDLVGLDEQELSQLWTRWYEHESRRRSLLLCAILDSQSVGYFSPFNIDLSARLNPSPRCQFLFAHVHEPCPDTLFLAWPPRVWADRLAASTSLPSSKGAKMAFQDDRPASIAACLLELLRHHRAHQPGSAAPPRFRSSFDFGVSSTSAEASGSSRSHTGEPDRAGTGVVGPGVAGPYDDGTEPLGTSARSSRRPSQADPKNAECEGGTVPTEARIVSQLYMSALLEAVHGAWMLDSGWCQSAAWGAWALPEQLEIDAEDFDIEAASLAGLPGWRVGRTLDATRVAHALMNWSEMFSGWKDGCHTRDDEAAAGLGLRITDDTRQLTIRWQAIFLGLCAPLPSLCYYLDARRRPSALEQERHRRVSMLLKTWVDSPYCRRALVHAGTILTLLCAARTEERKEPLGPSTSAHAAYMSLVVLVCTSKILGEKHHPPRPTHSLAENPHEELVTVKQVWPSLIDCADESKKAQSSCSSEHCDDAGNAREDGGWTRVRFWHRKFQFLGLAGIYREHGAQGLYEAFADWRASMSAAAGVGASNGLRRVSQFPPRWSSFAEEARLTDARRAIFERHMAGGDSRRASHAQVLTPHQDSKHDLLRRPHHRSYADDTTSASSETRRWILQGATHHATFCGLALWRDDAAAGKESGSSREHGGGTSVTSKVLGREQLRKLVRWVREDSPAWCFGQEYTNLLLGALQEAPTAGAQSNAPSADNGVDHGCAV